MAYKTKTSKRKYESEWYRKNKEKRNAQIRNSEKKRTVQSLLYLSTYLSQHPCLDCGEGDIVVLEFDHIKGEKIAHISHMARNGYSLDRIKEEIFKCEVVCANCHRKRTARRAGWDIKKWSYSLSGKAEVL